MNARIFRTGAREPDSVPRPIAFREQPLCLVSLMREVLMPIGADRPADESAAQWPEEETSWRLGRQPFFP
jgi:hypothetical protein